MPGDSLIVSLDIGWAAADEWWQLAFQKPLTAVGYYGTARGSVP